MTQEEKDLLLKDLCSRLPYRVKLQKTYDTSEPPAELYSIDLENSIIKFYKYKGNALTICDAGFIEKYGELRFKPYLFPFSSMTEEQRKEWLSLMIKDSYGILCPTIESFDYLYKNHIDVRGFIEKDLAIDATGLNIY